VLHASGDIGHRQKRQPVHHAAEVADVGIVAVCPHQSQVLDLAPCALAEVKKHPWTATCWPSVVRMAFIVAVSKSQTTVVGSALMPVRSLASTTARSIASYRACDFPKHTHYRANVKN